MEVIVPDIIDEFDDQSRISSSEISNIAEETQDHKNDVDGMLSDSSIETKVGLELGTNVSDKLTDMIELPVSETHETSKNLGAFDFSDKIYGMTVRPTNEINNSKLIGNVSSKDNNVIVIPGSEISETTNNSDLFKEFSERIQMNRNKLFCELCQKYFSTSGGFKKHLRLHAGDVDLFCSECGKGFCFKSHLESHMRTHTGEKPFECNICQRRFTLNGDLKKHQYLHTGEKPFECKVCHKAFTQLGDLNIHIRIHTGVKPFVCGICHRGFTHKSNLTQHHRTHTGEKPYPCHFCGKYFSQNVQLNRHLLTHGCPKPFICPICEKGFTAKYRYTKHLATHK